MYLPLNKPPETWNEEDLRSLCTQRIPETQRLDYKREMKLEPARERRELLKDITSLANAHGGVVIYGIAEEKHPDLGSIASELCSLQDTNLVDMANRVIQAHVSPAIECYLHTVPATQGGYYLIAHVPQSQYRPHAMVWDKRLDYYIRRNQDNSPMTEIEIRAMYRQTMYSEQTLHTRYKELHPDAQSRWPKWTLTVMPAVSGLDLLDTLTVSGADITNSKYWSLIDNRTNRLQPRVNRFEEIIQLSAGIRGTQLYRGGEFVFFDAFRVGPQTPLVLKDEYLFQKWYLALKFFGDLYTNSEVTYVC